MDLLYSDKSNYIYYLHRSSSSGDGEVILGVALWQSWWTLENPSCGHQGIRAGSIICALRALCSSKGDLRFTGFSLDVTLMASGLAMWDPFSLFVKHHGARRIGCADLTQSFLARRQSSRWSRKSFEDRDKDPCRALTSSPSIRFEEGTKPKKPSRRHWA